MDECCQAKEAELRRLAGRQKGVLQIVLLLNLAMFFIEGGYGLHARSTSLLADSLDMLGDATVYTFSLYVLGRSMRWNASAALLKGVIMALFGLAVTVQAVYRFVTPVLPLAGTMGWVGGLALAANVFCAALLLRHRNDDINMQSTWLCSRNDVIANLGVLAAAGGVAITQSKLPDLFVGTLIAVMFLRSAYVVLRGSVAALKTAT